jgi:hypothetical protein
VRKQPAPSAPADPPRCPAGTGQQGFIDADTFDYADSVAQRVIAQFREAQERAAARVAEHDAPEAELAETKRGIDARDLIAPLRPPRPPMKRMEG